MTGAPQMPAAFNAGALVEESAALNAAEWQRTSQRMVAECD
jgi:hypothetical protein